ncbi:hypothetical protein ZWY2020_006849 [Hordeum vulgare]|nr:hypothetical protein ZWY2020_006849 [Hordeum vulgare]
MAAFGGNGCCYSSGSEDEEEEEEGAEGYRKGGYHAARPGDRFAGGRFVAQRKLGWGNFSTVWLAYDTLLSRFVALKIQKSARDYAHAALHEIELLSAAAKGDPRIQVRHPAAGPFQARRPERQAHLPGHRVPRRQPAAAHTVQPEQGHRAEQGEGGLRSVLTGLDYMHRELGIIHTDLKRRMTPCSRLTLFSRGQREPVPSTSMSFSEKMLKAGKGAPWRRFCRRVSLGGLDGISMKCKIVDFGNACWAEQQGDGVIQTRQYRAPEVIIACMAFELATGDMLFAPNTCQGCSEDEDHLALMMETLGKMPKKIAISGTRSKDYFNRYGDLKRVQRLRFWPLERVLVENAASRAGRQRLADFLRPILDFDPENRPTAAECLKHAWLN